MIIFHLWYFVLFQILIWYKKKKILITNAKKGIKKWWIITRNILSIIMEETNISVQVSFQSFLFIYAKWQVDLATWIKKMVQIGIGITHSNRNNILSRKSFCFNIEFEFPS